MVVLVPQAYFRSYLISDFERVFSRVALQSGGFGQPIAHGCFVSGDWEMALVPGGMSHQQFPLEAIAAGGRAVGDEDFIITEISLDPPHQTTALASWSRGAVAYAERAGQLLFDSAMFGLSGRWGCYIGTTATPSCVGGDTDFMAAFFSVVGGREAMKRRFLAWADDEWELPTEQRRKILRRVWGPDSLRRPQR